MHMFSIIVMHSTSTYFTSKFNSYSFVPAICWLVAVAMSRHQLHCRRPPCRWWWWRHPSCRDYYYVYYYISIFKLEGLILLQLILLTYKFLRVTSLLLQQLICSSRLHQGGRDYWSRLLRIFHYCCYTHYHYQSNSIHINIQINSYSAAPAAV